MIQGILCFRIDCCGHEIAGSDDGTVNLGHTYSDPRAHKRTKRGACIVSPSCSLLSLQYLAKINDDDVRRILLRWLFPFPNIPFTNRFRKFSTVICRKDEGPPGIRNFSGYCSPILAPTFSKILHIYNRKMYGNIFSFASEFIASSPKIAKITFGL